MLQGFSNNPAAQQGLLATGLGMLSANQGGANLGQVVGRGGLLGMQAYGGAKQAEAAQREQAIKDDYMRQQMAQADAETKMKMAAYQQQQAQQEALNTAFTAMANPGGGASGGAVTSAIAPLVGEPGATPPAPGGGAPMPGGGAPMAPGGVGGAPPPMSAAGGPAGGPGSTIPNPFGAAPGSATAGALAQPGVGGPAPGAQPGAPSAQAAGIVALMQRLPPMQRDAAMADIRFNGGKNLPDFFKGKITVTPAGAMVNENTGEIVGYAPVMDTGTGRAYQLQGGGPGGQAAGVAALPGGLQNMAAGEQVKADIAAQHDWKQVTDDKTGQKRWATAAEIQANPALRVTERSPEVSQALQLGNEGFYKNDYTPAIAEGKAALGDIQAVQALRAIPAETGWGKEAQATAASFLTTLGVPGAEKIATAAQQFQSVAIAKLNDNLKTQPGVQTEGDANRASKVFASLANTPRANAFIQDYAEAQALLKQEKARYYAESFPYAQKRGDLGEIGRRWAKVAPSVWKLGNMAQYAPKGQ